MLLALAAAVTGATGAAAAFAATAVAIAATVIATAKRLPTAIARMVRMTAVSFMFPLAVAV
ncbi:unknown [Collinsella sp. CAG:166]|nr:unknown [Collinsella sp. CAG:166]